MDPQNLWQHVTVNVGAATMMTRLVLPQMMERKKGGIINLSSAASFCATPLMCVYSATKMYMNYFTDAIRDDYSKHGITVQCLTPFYITTNMTSYSDRIGKPAFNVPTARQYVRSALQSFGIAHTTTGYYAHSLMYAGIQLLPMRFYQRMCHQYQLQLRADGRANFKKN
jgi:short-subunit dehydrogenase